MVIKLRKGNGITFTIPVPKFIVKIGLSSCVEKFIKKYADENSKKYINHIDFKEIRKSMDILFKEYKGFVIVDIEAADGSKVFIRI